MLDAMVKPLTGSMSGPATSVIPAPALDLNYAAAMALTGDETFGRSTAGWYFDAVGVLTQAAINAPRFDHNPATLARRGLLIEEQRTNLFLNSAAGVTQSVTVTAAAHTLSFFGVGTITLSGMSTGTLAGTGATDRVSLTVTPTAGSLTLTVTGSAINVQLEAGLFATSPIVTAGATVTRAADVCTLPTSAIAGYDAGQGTLSVDALSPAGSGASGQYLAALNSGSSSNIIRLGRSSAATGSFVVNSATVTVMDLNFGSMPPLAPTRAVLAYAPNNFAGAVNGELQTDASGALPTGLVEMRVGSRNGNAGPWCGHIRRVRYWNTRLPASALVRLTLPENVAPPVNPFDGSFSPEFG